MIYEQISLYCRWKYQWKTKKIPTKSKLDKQWVYWVTYKNVSERFCSHGDPQLWFIKTSTSAWLMIYKICCFGILCRNCMYLLTNQKVLFLRIVYCFPAHRERSLMNPVTFWSSWSLYILLAYESLWALQEGMPQFAGDYYRISCLTNLSTKLVSHCIISQVTEFSYSIIIQ